MPLASFVSAAAIASPTECAASCGDSSAPDEAANSPEEYDVLHVSFIVPMTAPGQAHPLDRNVRNLFASHIVEPLIPPPNPSSPH